MTDEQRLYAVIQEIRTAFHVLAASGTTLHSDVAVTASERAVLEALEQEEPRTVPQIARDRSVTRQHIQTLVNELIERNLVEVLENPSHQRSSLIRRTSRGREVFRKMRARESRLLQSIARRIPADDLEVTLRTLQLVAAQVARAVESAS